MENDTLTWDELMASPTGAGIIVVSASGVLAQPRKDGFGDVRTATVEHYEAIGDVIAVTTVNTQTGMHSAYVIGQGCDLPQEGEWEDVAFYEAFDGRGIRIEADGGIKVVGESPSWTRDEAIAKARNLARHIVLRKAGK